MGLNSILLSSSILANSFLGPSVISYDDFINQMQEEVLPQMFEDLNGTSSNNWFNDIFVDEIYIHENGNMMVGVTSEYYFPNSNTQDFYLVNLYYYLEFDINNYDFIGISDINSVGYENTQSSGQRLVFQFDIDYDFTEMPIRLEPRINGQEINFWLMVDGDEVDESGPQDLPEFILDAGEEPESIFFSDILVLTDDWFYDNYDLKKYNNNLFGTITETISEYTNSLTNLFSDLIALFYVDNKLTFLGFLTLVGFGIGITKWGINLVVDLLRL